MDHLDEHLANAALNVNYPTSIKAAIAIGKKTLNRYYDKTDHSEVFRIAMGQIILLFYCVSQANFYLVLHPKHKLKYFEQAGWENEWVEKAEELVRTEFERSYKYTNNDFFAQTEPTVRRK